MSARPWIGVDLDGTLAEYGTFLGAGHIGRPVPVMLNRVLAWLGDGLEVRIFTARIHPIDTCIGPEDMLRFQPENDRDREAVVALRAIQEWCQRHIGKVLPVTNVKDHGMIELWDDRCVQVEPNTGKKLGESTRGLS